MEGGPWGYGVMCLVILLFQWLSGPGPVSYVFELRLDLFFFVKQKKTKNMTTSKSDNNEALEFQQYPIFSHTHLGSPEWFLRWLHADVRAHGQVPGVTACRLGLGLR